MDKFLRNYALYVETLEGELISIKLPFTVEFDITRNILTSANVCSIRVYNLSEKIRNKIRKNQFDTDNFKQVLLQAGYGDGPNWPIIFNGNISQAWSVRENVDFITQIECFDGGFGSANANFEKSYPAGTSQKDIITDLANAVPEVQMGHIGEYDGLISKGNTYSGNPIDILRDLTGSGVFIDNSKINVINDNECIPGEIRIINSKTGLLGTPIREQTYLNFDILFEPRLQIGQLIQLESSTEKNFNGQYKVISVHHKGIISAAISGDAVTSVGLFAGTESLKELT